MARNPRVATSLVTTVLLALILTMPGHGAEFTAPVSYSAGNQPYSVAVGDFNRDGIPDLAVAEARLRLARAGVQRVFGGGNCTYTEADKYFSHRRDGRTGRRQCRMGAVP